MKLKLWRAVLVIVLLEALTAPAWAESLDTAGEQIAAGIVIVSVAVGVLVTVLILHDKHKKAALTAASRPQPMAWSLPTKRTSELTRYPAIHQASRQAIE